MASSTRIILSCDNVHFLSDGTAVMHDRWLSSDFDHEVLKVLYFDSHMEGLYYAPTKSMPLTHQVDHKGNFRIYRLDTLGLYVVTDEGSFAKATKTLTEARNYVTYWKVAA